MLLKPSTTLTCKKSFSILSWSNMMETTVNYFTVNLSYPVKQSNCLLKPKVHYRNRTCRHWVTSIGLLKRMNKSKSLPKTKMITSKSLKKLMNSKSKSFLRSIFRKWIGSRESYLCSKVTSLVQFKKRKCSLTLTKLRNKMNSRLSIEVSPSLINL